MTSDGRHPSSLALEEVFKPIREIPTALKQILKRAREDRTTIKMVSQPRIKLFELMKPLRPSEAPRAGEHTVPANEGIPRVGVVVVTVIRAVPQSSEASVWVAEVSKTMEELLMPLEDVYKPTDRGLKSMGSLIWEFPFVIFNRSIATTAG